MTEYEILDLLANDSAQMAVQFTIYLSVMSGYLIVAYFAGDKLTNPQAAILTTLFFFATAAEVWGFHLTLKHIGELMGWLSEIRPLTEYEKGINRNGYPWVFVMGMGIFSALYFMWSVRHPKIE
jgi:hypothetical protein